MMSTVPATEDATAIRRRLVKLAADLYRPLTNAIQTTLMAGALAVTAGLAVGLLFQQPAFAGVTAIVVTAIGGAIAWWWLLDGTHRAGLELVLDHDCHERWEWKEETGTSRPTSAAAIRRWLDQHPTGENRASLLLGLGRLTEADAAIAAIEPRSPEEAFGVEILRKSREHLGNQRPDLAGLHASWRSLPNPPERRHRRECLAVLDAVITVADGGDPWPLLAQARADIGEVHRSMRIPWLAAKWAVFQLLIVALIVVVTVALVG